MKTKISVTSTAANHRNFWRVHKSSTCRARGVTKKQIDCADMWWPYMQSRISGPTSCEIYQKRTREGVEEFDHGHACLVQHQHLRHPALRCGWKNPFGGRWYSSAPIPNRRNPNSEGGITQPMDLGVNQLFQSIILGQGAQTAGESQIQMVCWRRLYTNCWCVRFGFLPRETNVGERGNTVGPLFMNSKIVWIFTRGFFVATFSKHTLSSEHLVHPV